MSQDSASTPGSIPRLRWARAQRFRLTGKGQEALRGWREGLERSRATDGRVAFDAEREAWAKTFGVQSDDGLLVSELSGAPMKLEDLTRALEDTGASREQLKSMLERLHGQGLVEAVTA